MKRHILNKGTVITAGLVAVVLAVGIAARSSGTNKENLATWAPGTAHYMTVSMPKVSAQEAAKAITSAKDLSTAFRAVSERVLPSVVAIENSPAAVKTSGGSEGEPKMDDPFQGHNPFEGTPFGDMFRGMPFGGQHGFQGPHMQPQPRGGGLGSGVIIDASGLILTNHHVVAGDGDVTVRLHDGREFKAAKVWSDPKTDVAVVKIEGARDLVAAAVGNSDTAAIGDWVLALGQPFGLESTVTAGIVSAKHRGIGINERENYLQTDAAINPGNSGGPLVNLDGEVVGINTAISSRSGGNEGIGFAIPMNLAKWVAYQLANGGTVHRAYLGVGIQPVTQQLADQFHVKPREGVVVTQVYPNTPAAKAGLETGDVILDLAGVRVSSPQELQLAVERAEIGKSHSLSIVRDGKRMNLTLTPEEQPSEFGASGRSLSPAKNPEDARLGQLGLEISRLDPSVAEQLGMKGMEGVVITDVQAGSPAERAGLESGMVITQVNRQPVKTVEEASKAIHDLPSDGSVLLLVRTVTGSRFVVVQP